jgi:hypothetical protein
LHDLILKILEVILVTNELNIFPVRAAIEQPSFIAFVPALVILRFETRLDEPASLRWIPWRKLSLPNYLLSHPQTTAPPQQEDS